MKKMFYKKNLKGQVMIEYMLLLGVVVSLVLVGLKMYFTDRVPKATETYFNHVSNGILGIPSRCGDGCMGPGEYSSKCKIDELGGPCV
jgi:hypothetical protein